jgi:hypothetical protein
VSPWTHRQLPLARLAWCCIGGSVGLSAVVGVLGDSAASPGLGPATVTPPWDLAARPSAALVTALMAVAVALGVCAVLAGVRAIAAGWRPRPRTVALAGAALIAVLVVVPPTGSADHLSYVAYGRIAAAGDDPYLISPGDWRGGRDPVAGAVQPPWQNTPSVYGPVGTAAQALVATAGGGSLRLTVWLWQLLCAAAFGLTAFVLDRLAARDPAARARVAVLWLFNPILLGQLVLGAHIDVLAAALGVGVLVAAARRPLLAGVLLGAAVGVKAPYALFGLAALWAAVRGLPRARVVRNVLLAGASATAVLVPAYRWAGPHAFDQLGRASGFTTLSSPWRAVADLGDLVAGHGALRSVITPLALLLAAAFMVPLGRRVARLSSAAADPLTADTARAALVATAAWSLIAPYALPWYDAMVWAPLVLLGASALDRLLLARLAALSLAYIPGRVVELTRPVSAVTQAWRLGVTPVAVLLVIAGVLCWTGDRWPFAADRPATARSGAEA